MASEVEICNRALQKLGAHRIVSLTENSVNARACNVAYVPCRDALLRSHPWSFAISTASLAADATPPDFGPANAFQLPSDFIRLLSDYAEWVLNSDDHIIQGQKIFSNDDDPLEIRYVSRVTDPNLMDPLFRECLSAKLALELCEELTQSNAKKESAKEDFKDSIVEARRANAFEKVSDKPAEDEWITIRR
jgi:hypothetical protein